MGSTQSSIVLVARVWRDDEGVRAVLQSSTASGEMAYRSIAEIRQAIVTALDDWRVEINDCDKPDQLE